jgi:hypothetical protein
VESLVLVIVELLSTVVSSTRRPNLFCSDRITPSVVRGVLSDRIDLLVFERHESLADEGEGVDALPDCVDALSLEDEESSGAGCTP